MFLWNLHSDCKSSKNNRHGTQIAIKKCWKPKKSRDSNVVCWWRECCLLMKGILFVRVGNIVFVLLTKVSNIADVRQQICWPSSASQKHASLFNQTYFFIRSNRLLEPTIQIIRYSCVLSPLEKVFVLFSAFYLARKNADKHGFSIMNNSGFSVFPCPIWHFASCSHNSPVYVYFFKWTLYSSFRSGETAQCRLQTACVCQHCETSETWIV